MRTALLIARKDLRQRMRDRSAIVLGLVAPLLIAALMSFAFKGTETFHYQLGVVNEDHGAIATELVHALSSSTSRSILTVENLSSPAAARADVRLARGCGLKMTAFPAEIIPIALQITVSEGFVQGVIEAMSPTGARS